MTSDRTGLLRATTLAAALVMLSSGVRADEGMWTFDNVPIKQIQQRYGFTVTQPWLDHLRLSSVRISTGGSGSFVSAHGLVLTNHHVALDQLEKVSTAQKNYVQDGFYAATPAEEIKCPDVDIDVLASYEDVTKQVTAAVTPGMSAADAERARRAAIARIEETSQKATGLRAEIVPLYQGGEYWLYRYKAYTDVRLVFAPEQQAAFFGGDPDNFTYPRYDLDFALFRVYENGAPISSRDYLKWSAAGAKAGDLVFVSGNPGSTERLETVAQLETQRDDFYPISLQVLKRRIGVLDAFGARGAEEAREASALRFELQNALKALTGEAQGLNDPKIFAKKTDEERAFRALVAKNAAWSREYGHAWDDIAAAETKNRAGFKQTRFEQVRASTLASLAVAIVEYAAEVAKPDADRLPGFHEAELPALRQQLFSNVPIYPPLEQVLLADSLQESLEELGAEDPFVKAATAGQPPAEFAKAAMAGTKLADASVRKALAEGGPRAIADSTDPLIAFARRVDPIVRARQKWVETNVTAPETAAGELIGRARFAAYGHAAYPDATFTLRLSYGSVKGYPMNGTIAPPETTFYGLYDRSTSFGGAPPFNLPARFSSRRGSLDLATPLDFVTTNDIIGGNSGSPVVNTAGELVGLIFDGNIESLVGNFVYSEETNRSVAVHSAAIIEALRKLYDAGPLADELTGR